MKGWSMTERKKAQDLFNETNLIFTEKCSFEEAFPTIEDIKIEVIRKKGVSIYDKGDTSVYTKVNPPGEFINCDDPYCYKGGFCIGSIIRDMVRNNATENEIPFIKCQGYIGSPKGKKKYKDCFQNFKVKISISYKE
jgi:hypothetical protein